MSAILHMVAIIVLALFTLRGVDEGPFELSALPSDGLTDEQFDEVELNALEPADLAAPEVAVEFQPITPVTDIAALEAATNDLALASAADSAFMDLAGGPGGLGQGAGKVRTSVFGLAAEGSTFVYVFDRSSSMNSSFRSYAGGMLVRDVTLLELAKAEMLRSLEPLKDSDQFQIVFYNHSPRLFDYHKQPRRLISASPECKSAAQQYVLNMPGAGGTNHLSALEVSVHLAPEVIFLITDGESKDDPPAHSIRRLIRACNDQGTLVHIIHFSTEPRPGCTLLALAEQTGGVHRFMDLSAMPGL